MIAPVGAPGRVKTPFAATALIVFVDASPGANKTGLGLVLRSPDGHVIGWTARSERQLTTNEAEYAALVFGLDQAAGLGARVLHIHSDSRVVIEQMRGLIGVNNARLKRWHDRALKAAKRFDRVTYTHVPREFNVLADAIAEDVLQRPALARIFAANLVR